MNMSHALRYLCPDGRSSDTPVQVTLDRQDFGAVSVVNPETGQPTPFPAQSLIMFDARSFREIHDGDGEPTGVWEFRAAGTGESGAPAAMTMYVRASSILAVKAMSPLA